MRSSWSPPPRAGRSFAQNDPKMKAISILLSLCFCLPLCLTAQEKRVELRHGINVSAYIGPTPHYYKRMEAIVIDPGLPDLISKSPVPFGNALGYTLILKIGNESAIRSGLNIYNDWSFNEWVYDDNTANAIRSTRRWALGFEIPLTYQFSIPVQRLSFFLETGAVWKPQLIRGFKVEDPATSMREKHWDGFQNHMVSSLVGGGIDLPFSNESSLRISPGFRFHVPIRKGQKEIEPPFYSWYLEFTYLL